MTKDDVRSIILSLQIMGFNVAYNPKLDYFAIQLTGKSGYSIHYNVFASEFDKSFGVEHVVRKFIDLFVEQV